MNPSRRSLLRSSLVGAPLLSHALLSTLETAAQMPAPSSEQWYWYPGHNLTLKSTAKDTGGTTSWMLVENSPRQGVPFHQHLHEDESFFVVDGLFEITVGDRTVTGGPGTYAYGPRNVPHRWTNMGTGRGRLLNVYTPGGFEEYFLTVAIPIGSSTEVPHVNLAEFQARTAPLREKYGLVRTGPLKYPVS